MSPAFWLEDAVISECGLYRPWLQRRGLGLGRAVFVMLNPSTADASVDDPTIRRCRGFAHREGCATFAVINLFTGRSPKPSALWAMDDPVGPNADDALDAVARSDADPVICAWGACPSGSPPWFRELRLQRIATVIERIPAALLCLGTTSDGSPRHPLYVRADQPLSGFAA
jgi:hypothetical protein